MMRRLSRTHFVVASIFLGSIAGCNKAEVPPPAAASPDPTLQTAASQANPPAPPLVAGADNTPGDPERVAAEWVIKSRGSVYVKHGEQSSNFEVGQPLPGGPIALVKAWLNPQALVTDDGLAVLEGSKIGELYINNPAITDVGIERIGRLSTLYALSLEGTQITDAGLSHLKGLTNLQNLGLSRTVLTGTGFPALKHLRIFGIGLQGTSITDDGFKHLGEWPTVHELNLDESKVNDQQLAHIARFPELRVLALNNTSVTDDGIAFLGALKSLQTLKIRDSKVTDGGINSLKSVLPNLQVER